MRQLLPVACDDIDPADAYADLPGGVGLNTIASFTDAAARPIVVTVALAPAYRP